MITLFIGRFQPLHNGHLHDLKEAIKFSDKVIVGVGSSNESNTTDNPFSFEERKNMIEKVIKKEHLQKIEILPIPDINDDKEWVNHVLKITGNIDIVYTGNNWVKRLFSQKNIEVRTVTIIDNINATKIRKRISKNEDWEELVPIEVTQEIKKIEGINRIKEINGVL